LFILGYTNLTFNSSSYILSNDGMEYAERMGEDVERSGKGQGVPVLKYYAMQSYGWSGGRAPF